MLDESALVLEGVTLAQVVELVVQVLVDLASGTVADEQTTENTHAAHPEDLAKQHIAISKTIPTRSPISTTSPSTFEENISGG